MGVLKILEIAGCLGMGWIAAWVSPKRAIAAVATSFVFEIVLVIVSRYNGGVVDLPWNLAIEFAQIALNLCLAVAGAKLARKWLVQQARRLAS